MVKMTLGIEGMACPMCEAHVNGAIRKAFAVKEVSSSHVKNETVIVADSEIGEADLRRILDPTGYRLVSVRSETL